MKSFSRHERKEAAFSARSRQGGLRIFLLLLTSAALEFSVVAAPVGVIPPADLLRALPPVPVEWKCKQSLGKVEFNVGGTPETSTIRQYEIPPKKEEPPPPTPPLPGIFNLVAVYVGFIDKYEHPPSTKPDNLFSLDHFTSGSLQARGKKDMLFSGRIGSRLLVQIVVQNIKPDDLKKILKSLNFTAMAEIEQRPPSVLVKDIGVIEEKDGNGKPINMRLVGLEASFVDELNPQSNRSGKITRVQASP
jgi:hypothetical protein